MKSVLIHHNANVKKKERGEKEFWLSKEKYQKIKRKEAEGKLSSYNLKIIEKEENRYYINLEKKSGSHRNKEAVVHCECGCKGKAASFIQTEERRQATRKYMELHCPKCNCTDFDIESEWGKNELTLSYARVYKDENKVTLSIGFHTLKTDTEGKAGSQEGTFQSYQTAIRLTYNPERKILYWLQPNKKIIRTISYGSMDVLQMHFMKALVASEEGKKAFCHFLYTCLKKAGIHEKKRISVIRTIKTMQKEHLFSKNHDSYAKEIFPLLAFPQIQAIENPLLAISIGTAPARIKQKVRASKSSAKDIIRHLYGFSNRRVMRFLGENHEHIMLLDLLSPLFQNKAYLMDVLEASQQTSYNFTRGNPNDPWWEYKSARMFLATNYWRKTILKDLKRAKREFEEEHVFRNELVKLLDSHYCQNDLASAVRFLEDIATMKKSLLRILPESQLPHRKDFVSLHHDFVREINKNKSILDQMDLEKDAFDYSEKEQALEAETETYRIRLATDALDLADIGKLLVNCVRSYVRKVEKNHSRILVLEENNLPKVCIEVTPNEGNRWTLVQASEYDNQPLSPVNSYRIAKWLEKCKIRNGTSYNFSLYKEGTERYLPPTTKESRPRIDQEALKKEILKRESVREQRYENLPAQPEPFWRFNNEDDLPF